VQQARKELLDVHRARAVHIQRLKHTCHLLLADVRQRLARSNHQLLYLNGTAAVHVHHVELGQQAVGL